MAILIKIRRINDPGHEITISSDVVKNDPHFLNKQGFELVPGQDLPDTLNTITSDPSEAVKKRIAEAADAELPVEEEVDGKVLIAKEGKITEVNFEVGNAEPGKTETTTPVEPKTDADSIEAKIAALHAQGKTVKEIAAELKLHWKKVDVAVKKLSK